MSHAAIVGFVSSAAYWSLLHRLYPLPALRRLGNQSAQGGAVRELWQSQYDSLLADAQGVQAVKILAMLLIVLSCLAATFPQPWPQPRPATLPPPALVRATAGPLLTFDSDSGDARIVPPQSAGVGSAAGRWEKRTVACGPFGQQRANGRFTKTIEVWVEDSSEKTKQQPGPDPSASPRQQPGASRPAAAFSCPGGVCPGGT